jgi:ABC-2 type transport system ATP-binding protein
MNNIIHTEQLTKKFGRVEALRGLNLDVPAGAVYALVGPNGAGKTTAIKVLMNIFPPTSGYAQVMETDTRQLRGNAFAAIGYVSENQELPLWMRVDGFLGYLRHFYPTWDRGLEAELVRQFELPLDRKLRHLSRGMRMKAALAGALAYRPSLIVLDEPFTGLDPLVRDELIESLLECAEEATVLISSHDLAEIESFASHVGYLDQGCLGLSEEMTALAERFRDVEVTLSAEASLPKTFPDSWMQPSASGAAVRFTTSNFNQERTTAEIRQVLGEVRNVTFTPMSLRSIFLALAKSERSMQAGGHA